MARRNHSTGFKSSECNKCQAKGHAPQGAQHRRCTGVALSEGQEVALLRPKHEKLGSEHRGVWN